MLDRHRTYNEKHVVSSNLPPTRFLVHGLVPEGLTVIAGMPKSAKSWFGLNMCYAVSMGRPVFGCYETQQAGTLFVGLEDSWNRLCNRLKMMKGGDIYTVDSDTMQLRVAIEPKDSGGEQRLREEVEENHVKLIVMDTLYKYVRDTSSPRNAYKHDVEVIGSMQEFAMELGIAFVLIHHTRKPKEVEHFLTQVSGTYGLTGGADTVIVIGRDSVGPVIYATGRDIDDIEKRAKFDKTTGWWTLDEKETSIHMTGLRAEVLEIFERSPKGYTISEFAQAWGGGSYQAAKKHVLRMERDGILIKKANSIYDIKRTIT